MKASLRIRVPPYELSLVEMPHLVTSENDESGVAAVADLFSERRSNHHPVDRVTVAFSHYIGELRLEPPELRETDVFRLVPGGHKSRHGFHAPEPKPSDRRQWPHHRAEHRAECVAFVLA